MDIIIDKSFLEGSSRSTIGNLCRKHHLMMPDILFYELITTTDGSRQKCFSKIPDIENPLVLIPNVGGMLRFENNTKLPCSPIYKRRIKVPFKFNKDLSTGEYEFTDEQKEARNQQIKEVKEDTDAFIDRVGALKEMFTDLSVCRKSEIPGLANKIKNNVITEPKLIKEIYKGTIGNSNLPIDINPDQIGKNWAIFRWIQIQLLYSLDLYIKYQGEIPLDVGENFWTNAEHDMLDSHYIVLGLLADGLASKDSKIIEMYNLLKPNGFLLT